MTCLSKWVTHRALGRENLTHDVVRLHAHPLDWLQAGCAGVCHVAPINRQALKELRSAKSIVCNCIHTAAEAWAWAFEPSWALDHPNAEPDLRDRTT